LQAKNQLKIIILIIKSMKKIALILVLVTSITISFGQKNVRQTASNYLKDGKLDKAMEAINQCILDPSTAQDAKAWFIRGNVYLEISNTTNEAYKNLDIEPLAKALASYAKSIEFDTKKDYYEDILAKLNWARNNYYNAAVENYNNKLYKDAMDNFGKAAEVMEQAKVSDTLSLLNAATCAALANDKESSKEFYLKLLKANYKTPNVYISLSDIYRQNNDSSNALKYVRMGQQIYPNDNRLFLAETNIYLTFNNTAKALNNLKVAMAKDSTNYSVAFALGTIYDNLSNDTTKTQKQREEAFGYAKSAYSNSIRLNPQYFEGNYNLGALYVNKAVTINEEATKLPLEETVKFDKLKKEADSYLELALPYLEKAIELEPTDNNTLITLKTIYVRTGKTDKVKAIQEKINALPHK
jgi:Tfp pilus assembly protein PilF